MSPRLALAFVLLAGFLVRGFSFFCYAYPTGTDYGHHSLYADLYTESGRLPATFPFYQLGHSRWSNLPGAAMTYSLLSNLSGRNAFEIAAITALFSILEIAGVYLLAFRLFQRPDVALTAALVDALLPSGAMIVAWSGYANVMALALLPYGFIAWLEYWERPDLRRGVVAVVALGAIAAIHHLSLAWVLLSLAGFSATSLILSPRASARRLLPIAALGTLAGFPLVVRGLELSALFAAGDLWGGSGRFDPTRLSWSNWSQTATAFSMVFLAGGLGLFLRKAPPAGRTLLASYTAVSLGFAFGWLFGIDFYYVRAIYFLAIPSALGASILLWVPAHPILRVAAAAAVTTAIGVGTLVESRISTEWYQALSPEVIEATDWLREFSDPEDVVVVGTSLGYHIPRLLARPTMVALTPELIGNPEDRAVADDATSILLGLENMDEVIDRRAVKYILVRSTRRDIPDAYRSRAVLAAHPHLTLLFQNEELLIYKVDSR